MAEQGSLGRPRVLLIRYTRAKEIYGVQHGEALVKKGHYVDLKTVYVETPITGGEYDLVIQLGLGEGETRFEGLRCVARWRKLFPMSRILAVSGHHASYAEAEARRYGADAYFERDTADDQARKAKDLEKFCKHVDELLAKAKPPR